MNRPPVSPASIDLAAEASDRLRGTRQTEIPGVTETVTRCGTLTRRDIRIETPKGASLLQRPMGSYITLTTPPLYGSDPALSALAAQAIADILPALIAEKTDLAPTDGVIFVGLGNRFAAADSLGPRFIDHCPVTRPYLAAASEMSEGCTLRPSSALAPGVLGLTGLEAFDIVRGAVEAARPALLLAVDALCAQRTERIGCTIQLSNTGIRPGSGLGNHRKAFNQETLGIPVISIGCPTIVQASVIASQLAEALARCSGQSFPPEAAEAAAKEVFSFCEAQLAVTPKDIEALSDHAARIIADGVKQALFPAVPSEELALYVPTN